MPENNEAIPLPSASSSSSVAAAAEAAAPALQKAQEQLKSLDGKLRVLVDQHPVAAVVGAVACGFFVGRLLARG